MAVHELAFVLIHPPPDDDQRTERARQRATTARMASGTGSISEYQKRLRTDKDQALAGEQSGRAGVESRLSLFGVKILTC